DDNGFYHLELEERMMFQFPPYCRLVKVTFRNKDKNKNNKVAYEFHHFLKPTYGDRLSVPVQPLVSYINHYHLLDVFLKLPRSRKEGELFRSQMNYFIQEVRGRPGYSNFRI